MRVLHNVLSPLSEGAGNHFAAILSGGCWAVVLSRGLPAVLAALLMLPSDLLCAQDRPTANQGVQALIDQLGADSYARREAASKGLLRRGLDVLPLLRKAEQTEDREVRWRIRALLHELSELDRRRQLSDFLAERPLDREHQLPGWPILQEIVGDTKQSRALLAEMLDSNWELLSEAAKGSEAAEYALAQRCHELRYTSSVQQKAVERADVAALLLMALAPDVAVFQETQQQIHNFCYRIPLNNTSVSTELERDDPFRVLLGQWVSRPVDDNSAFLGLNIALRFSLPEGLLPARQVLQTKNAAPYIRQYAVLTIARFGTRDHVELLEGFLDDKSLCYSKTDPRTKAVAFESQIRDVVLAVLFHLVGDDPKRHGFENARESSQLVFQPNSLGFANDEKRGEALAVWREMAHAAAPDVSGAQEKK